MRSIKEVLGEGGLLAQSLPGYEARPGQIQVAEMIEEAFGQGRVALIEAGTGIGKSLAYLIPAIRYAHTHKTRVVVSTHTLNLQDQLVGKDLPFLAKNWPDPVKFSLMKGRGNYLCLRRLFRFEPQTVLEEREWARLKEWALTQTQNGERQELDPPTSSLVWEEVASDSDLCASKCSHRGNCFYQKAWRQAQEAEILVVNHHLLLIDLVLRSERGQGLFPEYSRLVLDEAHHLEEVASKHLGGQVSLYGLKQLLGRIRPEGASRRGLLGRLRPDDLVKGTEEKVLEQGISRIEAGLDRVRRSLARLEEDLDAFLDRGSPQRWRGAQTPTQAKVEAAGQALAQELMGLAGQVLALASLMEDENDQAVEMGVLANRVQGAGEILGQILEATDPEYAFWMAPGARGSVLASAPVWVCEPLAEVLWQVVQSVILVSATLAVGGDFRYLCQRLGIELDPLTGLFPSPFPYEESVFLGLPTDLPEPQEAEYGERAAQFLLPILRLTQGRAFLLFTSYTLLRQVESYLSPLAREGYTLLRQGERDRRHLLESFRRTKRAILLGVDSFWEGVDVAGEALSLVVLTKLPFKVPKDPLIEARMESLQEQGRDPFREFLLPQAVLQFKQGFGRLIRSHSDQGIILVLDRRLVTRSYGQTFRDSLPLPVRVASSDTIAGQVEAWWRQKGIDPQSLA